MSHNRKEQIAAGAIFLLSLFAGLSAFVSDEKLLYSLIASATFSLSLSIICRQYAKRYLWSVSEIRSRPSAQKSLLLFVLTILMQLYQLLLCIAFCGIFVFDIFSSGVGQNVLLIGAAGFAGVLIASSLRECIREAGIAFRRIQRGPDAEFEMEDEEWEEPEASDTDIESDPTLEPDNGKS